MIKARNTAVEDYTVWVHNALFLRLNVIRLETRVSSEKYKITFKNNGKLFYLNFIN